MKKNLLLMCVATAIANQANAIQLNYNKNKVAFDVLVLDTSNGTQNVLNQSKIEAESNCSAKIVCQSTQNNLLRSLKLKLLPKITQDNHLNLSVDLKLKNNSGTFSTSKTFKHIKGDRTITITKDNGDKNLVLFITPHIK